MTALEKAKSKVMEGKVDYSKIPKRLIPDVEKTLTAFVSGDESLTGKAGAFWALYLTNPAYDDFLLSQVGEKFKRLPFQRSGVVPFGEDELDFLVEKLSEEYGTGYALDLRGIDFEVRTDLIFKWDRDITEVLGKKVEYPQFNFRTGYTFRDYLEDFELVFKSFSSPLKEFKQFVLACSSLGLDLIERKQEVVRRAAECSKRIERKFNSLGEEYYGYLYPLAEKLKDFLRSRLEEIQSVLYPERGWPAPGTVYAYLDGDSVERDFYHANREFVKRWIEEKNSLFQGEREVLSKELREFEKRAGLLVASGVVKDSMEIFLGEGKPVAETKEFYLYVNGHFVKPLCEYTEKEAEKILKNTLLILRPAGFYPLYSFGAKSFEALKETIEGKGEWFSAAELYAIVLNHIRGISAGNLSLSEVLTAEREFLRSLKEPDTFPEL